MNLLDLFAIFLREQRIQPSDITIKNYKSDIRQFIVWFEKEFSQAFSPLGVTPQIIEIYKTSGRLPRRPDNIETPRNDNNGNTISPRSMERHISSLRKFFFFLTESGHVTENPFAIIHNSSFIIQNDDAWKLKPFKEYLYAADAAPLTIKNYINDIQQFTDWVEAVYSSEVLDSVYPERESKGSNNKSPEAIDLRLIEEYKDRLLKTGFSPRTVNRKLSSLRKYTVWLKEIGVLRDKPSIQDIALNYPVIPSGDEGSSTKKIATSSLEELGTPRNDKQSGFPPLRLLQKIKGGIFFIFDEIVTAPVAHILDFSSHLLWIEQGRPVFKNLGKRLLPAWKVGSLPKALYAPLLLSNTSFPWHKKTLYYLQTSRPKWYKKYHSYAITHYFHLAVLLVVTSLGGLIVYSTVLPRQQNQAVLGLASETQSARSLSFSGKLTDKYNAPITKNTSVRFALYPDQTTPSPVWEETQTVTPSNNGDFTITLGKNSPMHSVIFTQNPTLYLGISIVDGSELQPRQQIQTTSYAENAKTLDGLPLITQNNDKNQNVVLALDSSGNLTIGKSAASTFQVTNGTFTLVGQSLVLTTAPGSNGDVQITADGTGQIDIQRPLHNTSNTSSIGGVPGAVEIADLLSIVATSSSQSAFTISQNDVGPIISASSGGTAKFTVANDGSTYIAGNVGIGWENAIAKLQVAGTIAPADNNKYDIGSPALRWNTLYVNNIVASSSGTLGYWQRSNNSIAPNTTTDSVIIGGKDKDSSKIYLSASSDPSFVRGGNFGIGTATPTSRLQIQGSGTTTGTAVAISDSNGMQHVAVLDNGNVGIGDSSPTNTLKVVGSLCVGTSSQSCAGTTPGTLYADNTSVQAADLAENYISSEMLEPGDVVVPANDGNNMAVVKTTTAYQQQVIGIISTKPGVTLNSHAATDSAHPNLYPLGLAGRVPVKVTNENGDIAVGDMLTTSSLPGYAMKATKTGAVIGKALEGFSCSSLDVSLLSGDQGLRTKDQRPETSCQGKIVVFVNLSFYDPAVQIATPIYNSIEAKNKQSFSLTAMISDITTVFARDLLQAQYIVTTGIEATAGTFKNLYADTLISPLAQIDELHTNTISALTPDTDLVIKLASSSGQTGGKLVIQNASGSAVASIDSTGNASFSGTLVSQALSVQTDVSVAGTLRAKKIIADQIDLPANAMRDALQAGGLAQNITNVTNIYQATSNQPLASSSGEIASSSGSLASLDALPGLGKFEQGIIALGPSSFTHTSVSGNLTIGRSMVLSDNSLNVYGADLEIQPFRQGGVSFLSGLVRIDANGNLIVTGNASFAHDVQVAGNLSANILSPLPDQDLILSLRATSGSAAIFDSEIASSSATPRNDNQRFVIQDASGSGVLTINQLGDIIASGTATLKKLNFGSVPQAIAISDTEIQASGAAGIATMSANRRTLTINNPLVTDTSLIYLTPRIKTNNQTLFLERQEPNVSFTVGLENTLNSDVSFNWLIIN